MRKLIAFLGLTDYREVTYRYRQRDCVTSFVQAALAQFLMPDRVIVLVTPEAQAKHDEGIRRELQRQGLADHCLELRQACRNTGCSDRLGIY